jgi:M6 family metalloprotease-like protein
MEPLSTTERRRLTSSGEITERMAFAKRIGNHRVDPSMFSQSLLRTARHYFQDKGVPEEKISRLMPAAAPPPAWRGMPTTGAVKTFALLIEFKDTLHTNPESTIHNALYGKPATGQPYESLADYYQRASYNKLDLSGGVTLGWYKVDKNRSDVAQTTEGREAIIKEALQHYESQGHNFKQYDNNNDGAIDYFMVFWTGPDNGWANFWWGYQPTFSDQNFKVSGVKLGNYSWQWEANPVGSAFNPRVAIHETGHALGLPDLYDYDGNVGPDGGVGGADMMDGVQYDLNCFSKWMLDWLTPKVVGSGTQALTLKPSGTSPDCVAIWPHLDAGDVFSEFFMVQNRQKVGNDSGLPGQGLMIWHIDASLDASGKDFAYNNSYTPHKLVRVMEADAKEHIEANGGFNVDDLYVQGKSFGPATTPASTGYDNRSSLVEVTNIAASGSQISAVFKVGTADTRIVSDSNADGRLEVFYAGANDALYHNWQTKPNGGWSGAAALGGFAKQIAVGRNQDGRLEIFYVGTNDVIYHNWQTKPSGGWSGESAMSGSAKQIAVGRNQDGRLEIFYVGANDALYHNWQTKPSGGWSGEAALGGLAKQVAVGRNQDGRLEIFYVGTNDALYHNWQTKPNGGWSGEAKLGGFGRQIVVAQNADGRLEVLYIGTNDALYHNWQTKPNSDWSGEAPFGGFARQIVVGQNSDGRLELFYIGTNDALYHNWQTKPSGGWSGEAAFGGAARQIAVAKNADGRLELFYIGTNDIPYHNWQTKPSNGWSGESQF